MNIDEEAAKAMDEIVGLEFRYEGCRPSAYTKAEGLIAAFARRCVAAEREACAKVAEEMKGGYTASFDGDILVRDCDGPWVLNSDAAQAIRQREK